MTVNILDLLFFGVLLCVGLLWVSFLYGFGSGGRSLIGDISEELYRLRLQILLLSPLFLAAVSTYGFLHDRIPLAVSGAVMFVASFALLIRHTVGRNV